MSTEACNLSDGRRIIGKDCDAQKYLERILGVDGLICEMIKKRNEVDAKIEEYCPRTYTSESSSSSSAICCPVEQPEITHDWVMQIDVNDLDEGAYELLEILEAEACALYRKLILFSKEAHCSSSESSSTSESSSEGLEVDCSTLVDFTGNQTYKEINVVAFNSGVMYLEYNTFNIPKRFVVTWDGIDQIDTGYVGDPMYELDLFVANGSTIVGPSIGLTSFNKTTDSPSDITVKVYSPIINGDFAFKLYCPDEYVDSSSSSEEPSSSSSSGTPHPCDGLPTNLTIISMCPLLNEIYEMELVSSIADIDYFICGYTTTTSSSSSSSSSSSGEPDSSSSSAPPPSSSSSSSCYCEVLVSNELVDIDNTVGAFEVTNNGDCELVVTGYTGLGEIVSPALPEGIVPFDSSVFTVNGVTDLSGTEFVVHTSCGDFLGTFPSSSS